MRRPIQITYPDGSIHNVVVYRADTTTDGRIVISYLDGEENCFTEIMNVNGVYYKNPQHRSWEYYTEIFRPFDMDENYRIINELPEKMASYKKEEIKKTVESPIAIAESKTLNPPKEIRRNIRVIVYANAGGSLVDRHPTSLTKDGTRRVESVYDLNTGTSFYQQGSNMFGNEQRFYNALSSQHQDISVGDKQNIISILETIGSKFDISNIPPFTIKATNGDILRVSFSSCASWKLFFNTLGADRLIVGYNNNMETTYPDALSSALHYQLPLSIDDGVSIKTNGIGEEKKGSYK